MRLFKIIPAAVAFLSFCKSGHAGVLDKNVVDNLQSQLEDQLGLDKRTYIPKLSNVYCGDNTKYCNIGFTYLYVEMYKFRWEMLTPRATIIETFRKEKKDKYEYVSMVTTMSNYNIFFPVYISGEISSGGCINDKGNTLHSINSLINQRMILTLLSLSRTLMTKKLNMVDLSTVTGLVNATRPGLLLLIFKVLRKI